MRSRGFWYNSRVMDELELNYPPELPVSAHREAILAALRAHDAVIVCGDTGSGKTTQLPKMALELRRERVNGTAARRDVRRIACTQPRRLAAVTMAERVAGELGSPVGGLVGYRHRFDRRISSDTRIEFMTDGVLLAETRFDPLLRAYDTIIVDEAHERSLNIDFLLGILKRILARRRDLKVIVSSATLDAARFAAFFGDAPVISVPGRLYPIEISYRPPPDDEDRDLPRDVAAAVAELPPEGDILVFLPGERDIRECADQLAAVGEGRDDIIPLLASLPAAEQRRAFRLSPRRRIILATNVAETSVTIPGIRAVIDSGLSRISRYIHRTQVQRLQVEPISQASARQRAGRCGRLGPGICLRLYSEEDFASRDAYTPPEVLRSSLAGVILTMLDLGLGDITEFPFLDPPKPTMVREGLRELLELGAIRHTGPTAIDSNRQLSNPQASHQPAPGQPKAIALTDIGRKLARIPVEPRLARMLLAASRNAVLPSTLPLVAAMACDDPRRRPIDARERADQAHARFRVPGSDFLGTLRLWRWWTDETRDLSQSKARKLCKETFLSYPKMREWRDLARQLESLARRLGLDVTSDNGGEAMIHRSLLAGLLGRIGHYDEEERNYRGAHGLRFAIHPGSVLAKRTKQRDAGRETREKADSAKVRRSPAEWIVAGELVDTSRLFARNAAIIDVDWLEPVAGSICKHSYHSPEWDARSGFVRATEQVTLYGLVIVPARRRDYSRIDPIVSRDVFIRRGLIDGEFPSPPAEVRANERLLDALRRRAERARRPELFDAERLREHFDRVIPSGICSADALRKWLRTADGAALAAFTLRKADWWPSDSAADRDFPDLLRIGGARLALTYCHTPDYPERDGVTCSVRRRDMAALLLWRADWLVPGLLSEKLAWMLSTLPSALRRALAPLDDAVTILRSILKPGAEPLETAVRHAVYERWGLRIPSNAWTAARMPPHLQMRFCIRDDVTGRSLAASRDLTALFKQFGDDGADEGFHNQPSTASTESRLLADGTSAPTPSAFFPIPEQIVDRNSGWETVSYPALLDEGGKVSRHLYPDATTAAEVHECGVTRLYINVLSKSLYVPFRRKQIDLNAALYLRELDYTEERIASDLLAGAIHETFVRGRTAVRTAEEFERRLATHRPDAVKAQAEMTSILVESAAAAARIGVSLEDARVPAETAESVTEQLAWLLFRGFPAVVPLAKLRHYRRYLKGAAIRIERARLSPSSDRSKEERFAPYWARYREAVRGETAGRRTALAEYRWLLEEYRVSLFAQELHTAEPVSPKRLDAKWGAFAAG